MTNINFASITGTTTQKLETLGFLRQSAIATVRLAHNRKNWAQANKAKARLEAIEYEISKYTN